MDSPATAAPASPRSSRLTIGPSALYLGLNRPGAGLLLDCEAPANDGSAR